MPVMDGLEGTRQIRRYEKEKEIARPALIIALTGLGSKKAQQDAVEAGLNQFISKPVKFGMLTDMLVKR